MATTDKDTIYVDVDDEITGIIDKVRSSSGKIVALVLPKRATVLQSIVNMKLLKRSTEAAKKHIVLITSEAGLMPLAATVGLHVAKTPQSKPEIPALAAGEGDIDGQEEAVNLDDDTDEEVTATTAGNKPVGELASKVAGGAVAAGAVDEVETLDLDNDAEDAAEDSSEGEPKATKNKKLHIPNFDAFRLRLALGALLLILLIVGFIFANSILPKATITLTTDTSNINSNLTLNLDSGTKTLNTTSLTVPAQLQQVQKSSSQQVAATGQKNTGQQATGSVTMTAQECAPNLGTPNTVPAGVGVTTGGLTFITQQDTNFVYNGSKGTCVNFKATADTPITAQSGGANYNVSSATFTVVGRSDVNASGTTSGGTDNIIKTVAQADIDSATQKIAAQDTSAIKTQLQQQLQQAGYFAVLVTFAAGTPSTSSSANVGDQADNVTVTQAITYTMLGVKQADLKTLVDNDVKGQIDPSKQVILSEGLSSATFKQLNASATAAQVQLSTVAVAGPDLPVSAVQAQAEGKKSGDIQTTLKNNPGVTNVVVHFSPFWVNVAPKKAAKITVIFDKTTTAATSNASSN